MRRRNKQFPLAFMFWRENVRGISKQFRRVGKFKNTVRHTSLGLSGFSPSSSRVL